MAARKAIVVKPGQDIPDISDPWKDDVMHRKDCARFLKEFILSSVEPTTIFLNGTWGSGKSFFLNRLRLDLENAGVEAVEFNAWFDDYIEDPIIALIGCLHKKLHNKPGYTRNIKTLTKKVGTILLAGLDEVNSFVEDKTGIDAERFVKACGSRLAQKVEIYAEMTADRSLLRDRLVGLVTKVQKDSGNPLVFIIDELDRCEPAYAVRLLERIKHYFSIPGIVFVVGVDREQLGHTVRAAYGEIDIENYLRRFIDFDFWLPLPDCTEFLAMLWKKHGVDAFVNSRKQRTKLGERMGSLKAIFGTLSKLHGLTLREMEAASRYLAMILKSSSLDDVFPAELAAPLAIMKVIRPDVVCDWASARLSAADIVNAILPIDTDDGIPCAMDVVAAVYATHVNEVAGIAHSAIVFARLCKERDLDCDEIRVKTPDCLRQKKKDDLKELSKKIEDFSAKDGDFQYSHKMLLKLVARIDFMQYDASRYSAMRDDIIAVDRNAMRNRCPVQRKSIKIEGSVIPIEIRNEATK